MIVIMQRPPRYRYREKLDDGAIIEVVVWDVPTPVVGSAHHFKYRCFYDYPGRRLVGYDNERPKGDHRHYDRREEPYQFESLEKLIEDFFRDVQTRRTDR
jgi:hypothetical protein